MKLKDILSEEVDWAYRVVLLNKRRARKSGKLDGKLSFKIGELKHMSFDEVQKELSDNNYIPNLDHVRMQLMKDGTKLPLNLCRTANCAEKRHHMDRTGWCRKCQVEKGMREAKPLESTNRAKIIAQPQVAGAKVEATEEENDDHLITIEMTTLHKMFFKFSPTTVSKAVSELFTTLDPYTKNLIIEKCLEVDETVNKVLEIKYGAHSFGVVNLEGEDKKYAHITESMLT